MTAAAPRRLAIWDPAALQDTDGRLGLRALQQANFAWDALQIRDKQGLATLPTYQTIAKSWARPLWINRDAKLATKLRATGLVIGMDSLSLADEWPALVSVHSVTEAVTAVARKPIGVIFGPILATPSKPGQTGVGWQALRDVVVAAGAVPVLAIGGLTLADEAMARTAGAHGIAAIRAAFAVTAP